MWAPFWAAFGTNDFEAHKTKAHSSMVDVQNDRTTLWEKRGNDAADEFAKRGAALHGVEASDYHLWRGLVEASREAGRWSGRLHALVGDGEAGQDHADLMEQYAASREGAADDDAPALPPEGAAPSALEPAAAAEVAQSPAEGFEDYRDIGYSFNGHPMLHARVTARSGHDDLKSLNFCCACGFFSRS